MAGVMVGRGIQSQLASLQQAIREGRAAEAADLATRLAKARVPCVILDKSLELTELEINVESKEGLFLKKIFVDVMVSDTFLDLKNTIFRQYGYPLNCQRWIINNKLVKSDTNSLAGLGISTSKKSDVFLNLIEPKQPGKPSTSTLTGNVKIQQSFNPFEIQRKPKPVILFEGWVCGQCTFKNEPTRPGCEMCTASPPDDYVIPANYVKTPSEEERIRKEKENLRALEEAARKQRKLEEEQARKEFEQYKKYDEMNLVKNIVPFECSVCFADVETDQGVTLRDCIHTFCVECLQGQITNCTDAAVGCPAEDCPSFILDREIKELVAPDIYQQYLQRSMNIAESQIKDSYHCITPDCRGWCVYEVGVNTFPCPLCKARNCLTCRAIHENLTCKEYQDDIKLKAKTNEDARKTQETINEMIEKKEAMLCPNCGVVIMRMSGCGFISCTYCKLGICWMTKQARWGPKGQGDLTGGCQCRVNNVKCHPDCYSCH